MASTYRHPARGRVSRLLSALAVLAASVACGVLLFPDPLADAFFAGWVLVGVVLSLVGAVGAWTNRTPLVWVAALLLAVLVIMGLMSIGLFIAPAALLLLGSAIFSQLAGPRAGPREAIIADPPATPEIVGKSLAGIGSVLVGAVLVYLGAFARELFSACASETLACALDKTHWDAVAITTLGLLAVGFGGWLIWKQIYVTRVLAAEHGG